MSARRKYLIAALIALLWGAAMLAAFWWFEARYLRTFEGERAELETLRTSIGDEWRRLAKYRAALELCATRCRFADGEEEARAQANPAQGAQTGAARGGRGTAGGAAGQEGEKERLQRLHEGGRREGEAGAAELWKYVLEKVPLDAETGQRVTGNPLMLAMVVLSMMLEIPKNSPAFEVSICIKRPETKQKILK